MRSKSIVTAIESPSPSSQTSRPALEDLALLRDFEQEDCQILASYGEVVSVPCGKEVIAEGASHDALFIVLEGCFEVRRGGALVAELAVGQICGEMEVLNPPQSSASVSAVASSTIWRLTRDRLREFMTDHPTSGDAFMRLLTMTFSTRLQE